MISKILYYGILVLSIFLLWSVANLAYTDWVETNVCPKLTSVPACYIILVCAVLVLLAHINVFGQRSTWVYFIATGIPWLIAVVGSVQQMMGQIECPKTSEGTPMCYLSLAFFSTLIVLKYLASYLKTR